jgi:hypothetical protein
MLLKDVVCPYTLLDCKPNLVTVLIIILSALVCKQQPQTIKIDTPPPFPYDPWQGSAFATLG